MDILASYSIMFSRITPEFSGRGEPRLHASLADESLRIRAPLQ